MANWSKPIPPADKPAPGRLCPDLLYTRLFEQNADGAAVLQELCEEFYYRGSFDPTNSHVTSFHEGQRSVVAELLERISRGGQ